MTSGLFSRKRTRIAIATGAAVAVVCTGAAAAQAARWLSAPSHDYGSSLAPVPGKSGYFYGLTDRGPNADAPDGNKSEMVIDFTPEIGEFKLVKGKAELLKQVTLKGPKSLGGVKYSGRPRTTRAR